MDAYPFAVLISPSGDSIEATHLPFLVDPARGPRGMLLGHVARANPHWRRFDGAHEATAIFTGPHAYVSPSWYTDPQTVPTWNYAVVHAHGRPAVIDEKRRVLDMLEALVSRHESALEPPWTLARSGPDLHAQLDHIVAFEMPITRLEGKFKLSQNRSAADRRGVANRLAAGDDALQRALAAAMRDARE